ncbi:hypothetical protein [Streptomyces sp. ECR3.8]|uniref:hypothetical protein n=1 Tax=Streptomyces sp. ECR3.8 TaxID=3461009 RepID=UPI004041E91B
MAETNHTPPTEEDTTTTVPRAFGYCAWHQGHADGVRLIDVIEQGSGSGGTVFACGPCIAVNNLVPFADR